SQPCPSLQVTRIEFQRATAVIASGAKVLDALARQAAPNKCRNIVRTALQPVIEIAERRDEPIARQATDNQSLGDFISFGRILLQAAAQRRLDPLRQPTSLSLQ